MSKQKLYWGRYKHRSDLDDKLFTYGWYVETTAENFSKLYVELEKHFKLTSENTRINDRLIAESYYGKSISLNLSEDDNALMMLIKDSFNVILNDE